MTDPLRVRKDLSGNHAPAREPIAPDPRPDQGTHRPEPEEQGATVLPWRPASSRSPGSGGLGSRGTTRRSSREAQVIVRPPTAIPESDDVTEPIPVITAPKSLRPATIPTSPAKAEPARPPASNPVVPGLATTGLATTGPATTGPATTGPATTGPATATAVRSGPDLAPVNARPAHGGTDAAQATAWAEPVPRRRRRSRQRRNAVHSDLPEELMLRPLFIDESPLDEVLATVRAESAGITPWSGTWPAVIVVAVAVMTLVLLAAGVLLLFAK